MLNRSSFDGTDVKSGLDVLILVVAALGPSLLADMRPLSTAEARCKVGAQRSPQGCRAAVERRPWDGAADQPRGGSCERHDEESEFYDRVAHVMAGLSSD